jgi:hypothetical protein
VTWLKTPALSTDRLGMVVDLADGPYRLVAFIGQLSAWNRIRGALWVKIGL